MQRTPLRRTRWLLLLLCLSFLLSGCASRQEEAATPKTLWVVTETTVDDSFNYQAQQAIADFEQLHPDITVQLDILPLEDDEREIRLKQLRAQIMAGKGPDVYLLPTSPVLTTSIPYYSTSWKFVTTEVEPLFRDVTQAMHSGMFADVSSYYDADAALNAEGLHPDVMNAGVIGSARYVLPLRYTMPVLLTKEEKNAEAGIDQAMIDSGIAALIQHALDTDNLMLGAGIRWPDDLTMLPQVFDYEKGEMLVTPQQLAAYLRLYQQWRATGGEAGRQFLERRTEEVRVLLDAAWPDHPGEIFTFLNLSFTWDDFNAHIGYGRYFCHWSLEPLAVFSHDLPGALEQTAISYVLKTDDLQVHPLRNIAGESVAEVVYWCAVGSSCSDPATAYDYVRLFLTEEYQHDGVRPKTDRSNEDLWNPAREQQVPGLIEDSWPVRVKGSPEPLWKNLQYQLKSDGSGITGSKQLTRRFKNKQLIITDEDMPILFQSIDAVHFPICQTDEESLAHALTLLNDEDGTPTDVDVDALAQEVYQYLWWHLAEG